MPLTRAEPGTILRVASFIMWFGNTGNTIIACLLRSARACAKMSVLCKPTAGSVAGYCVNMWTLGQSRVRPASRMATAHCSEENFTYFAEFVSNTIISIDQCQIRFKIHICIMIALLRSYFKHSYLLNINYMDPSPIENHEKRNEE